MSVCVECGERKRDCCRVVDAANEFHVGYTVFDLARIRQDLKRAPSTYAKLDRLTDEEMKEARTVLGAPADLMFPYGLRIALDVSAGSCLLLTERGCPLPFERRPRFCAMYPCSYDPDDGFALYPFYWSSTTRCLAVERAAGDPEALFRLLELHPRVLTKLAYVYHTELVSQSKMPEEAIIAAFNCQT